MRFYALGLNHEHASVEKTEAFALDEEEQRAVYEDLILSEEAEVVLLSTCNRTEAYLYGTEADVKRVQAALARVAGHPWPDAAFRRRDEAAVRHVLEVTAGLKSMVIGDQQILAQVKEAYQRAVDAHQVHSLMHRLLHTAFRAAKRVSNETNLARGAASVSTAAVEMARQYFADCRPARPISQLDVLLVGAGKMGQLAMKALQEEEPGSIAVTNRSPERAQTVAETYGGTTVAWADRHQAALEVDLVFVATGAPEPVLRSEQVPNSAPTPSTLLVDIARPRNVDPSLAERSGLEVYDLDDLQVWAERVRDRRSMAVPEAEAICEDLLSDFVTWVFHQQALQPAIEAIRKTFDTIRKQEVDRHAHRTDMDREEVDQLTQSIMQKLLAVPIVRLKNVDPESIDFVQGIRLLEALFSPSGDDGSGRSLEQSAPGQQPTLADAPSHSDAPSHCPYLTHDPGEDESASRPLTEALRMGEEDLKSAQTPQNQTD